MTDETCPFCGSPIIGDHYFIDFFTVYHCDTWQYQKTGEWLQSYCCLQKQRDQLVDTVDSLNAGYDALKFG